MCRALVYASMVLQETTVDNHHIAVAVTTCFRGKVQDRSCHLFLIAHSLLGNQLTGHNTTGALPLLRYSRRHISWEPCKFISKSRKLLQLARGLTSWCDDIAPDIERHEEGTQVLHQMVRPSFASIVDKACREPVQAAYAAYRDDLARRRAFRPTLVARV